ncbi:class III extradiol ring-cleavage dioxygenase family protein [Streptomyces tendae]|uniref:hypothetical protein n=1 Tax=Streptomyces tendae TaxID=1932 RepID=UPI00371E6F58
MRHVSVRAARSWACCGVFAGLGFADALSPFDTAGDTITGMTTNTALSAISTVVGLALLAGAVVGGNFASVLNMTVGALFVLSGRLSHDNPYWQRRHPEQAAREREAATTLPDAGRERRSLTGAQSADGSSELREPNRRPPTTGMR